MWSLPPPPPDPPERPIDKIYRCWACYVAYPGSPKDHICPDGATFQQRLDKLAQRAKIWTKEGYSKLILTAEDRRFLRNQNIKIDD